MDDLLDAIEAFEDAFNEPERVYLLGISEGALIATLAIEKESRHFDGAIAACGPYGNFRAQSDYVGDFRVLFDYFFPDLLPGTPIEIPDDLIEDWDEHFTDEIEPELRKRRNANELAQLLAVAGVALPDDEDDDLLDTKIAAVERLLWYNIVGTNDAIDKLDGQPFDNIDRTYSGSEDDDSLNEKIARFEADDGRN